jgi:hypothetical protein
MRKIFHIAFACLLWGVLAHAAAKPHVITFGKWLPVKWMVGPTESQVMDMRVRSLYVDGKVKEFTTGEPHDVTDRLFVVRRVFRLNDRLPVEEKMAPRWKWQKGGWLMVDRSTGRVSPLNLPEFDPFYSQASWFRDYAAYCGVSDDGERLYAVVAEVGRKKPVLKKELGTASDADSPDAQCVAPEWQRQPVRVTFQPRHGDKLTYSVHGRAADVAPADEKEDGNQ